MWQLQNMDLEQFCIFTVVFTVIFCILSCIFVSILCIFVTYFAYYFAYSSSAYFVIFSAYQFQYFAMNQIKSRVAQIQWRCSMHLGQVWSVRATASGADLPAAFAWGHSASQRRCALPPPSPRPPGQPSPLQPRPPARPPA